LSHEGREGGRELLSFFVIFVAVESRGEEFFEQARFGCGQGLLYDLDIGY